MKTFLGIFFLAITYVTGLSSEMTSQPVPTRDGNVAYPKTMFIKNVNPEINEPQNYQLPYAPQIGWPPLLSKGISTYLFEIGSPGVSVSIGVTAPWMFNEGFRLRGAMYGGNLHDGARLLVLGFGNCIKNGDKVKMQIDYTGSKEVKISFQHNEDVLGLAYSIPRETLPVCSPVISFMGAGGVQVTELSSENEVAESLDVRSISQKPPPCGKWISTQVVAGGKTLNVPAFPLSIQQADDNPLRVSARLNILNQVLLNGALVKGSTNVWTFDERGASTLMAGPDLETKLEFFISSAFMAPGNRLVFDPKLNCLIMTSHVDSVPDLFLGLNGEDQASSTALTRASEVNKLIPIEVTWVRAPEPVMTFQGDPFEDWVKNNPETAVLINKFKAAPV